MIPINHEIRTEAASTSRLEFISVTKLQPGASQPRQNFDEEGLTQLSKSISNYGVLQPIVVQPLGPDHFSIVAGERRWRAACLAGLAEIPCIVRTKLSGREAELALIENIQRQQLSPIEEATALHELISDHSCTHEELAERLGVPRTTLTNTVRLLQLPRQVQDLIHFGRLGMGHGKALLTLGSASEQLRIAELAAEKSLSVRKTEELARKAQESQQERLPTGTPLNSNLRLLCDQFKGHLGTKVKISGDESRGRIEISYYSQDDLDRISEMVLGELG